MPRTLSGKSSASTARSRDHPPALTVVRSRLDILFVSPWHPWPATTAGAHQRIFQLVAALAQRHRVTLVTPLHAGEANAPDDPLIDLCARVIRIPDSVPGSAATPASDAQRSTAHQLKDLLVSPVPRSSHWRNEALLRALRQLRLACRFDAVWAERTFTAELLRQAGFDRIIVDVDDVASIAMKRHLRHYAHTYPRIEQVMLTAERLKLTSYERGLPRRYAHLVVCKEADREFFGKRASCVHVVPNGATPYSACDGRGEDGATTLFVGNLAHFPNVDAVSFFWDAILPEIERLHAGARFVVAGRSVPPALQALHDGQSCIITGPIPDLAPIYATASLVVVPMRLGSGTRIKVLEALARGKAMVSTSIGIEGIDLRPGIDVIVADEPKAFAQTCARLLGDAAARRRLGRMARERVLDRYGWDMIADAADRVVHLAARSLSDIMGPA
jgi:glycosyltransferase involved in cell wall biosynthesis